MRFGYRPSMRGEDLVALAERHALLEDLRREPRAVALPRRDDDAREVALAELRAELVRLLELVARPGRSRSPRDDPAPASPRSRPRRRVLLRDDPGYGVADVPFRSRPRRRRGVAAASSRRPSARPRDAYHSIAWSGSRDLTLSVTQSAQGLHHQTCGERRPSGAHRLQTFVDVRALAPRCRRRSSFGVRQDTMASSTRDLTTLRATISGCEVADRPAGRSARHHEVARGRSRCACAPGVFALERTRRVRARERVREQSSSHGDFEIGSIKLLHLALASAAEVRVASRDGTRAGYFKRVDECRAQVPEPGRHARRALERTKDASTKKQNTF